MPSRPRNCFDKCSDVRILAWNVQGLDDDVLIDPIFINCLDNSDIVILTETWLEEPVNIQPTNFYTFNMLRPLRARAVRPSGGISILIRYEFRGKAGNGFKVIKEDDFSVWLKLCKEVLNIERDIYVCGSYIPPIDSSFYKNREADPFSQLEQDINNFQKNGDVIMLGDLNAPTAELQANFHKKE